VKQLDARTASDLEWDDLKQRLSREAVGASVSERLLNLGPFKRIDDALHELHRTKEYLTCRQNGESIPRLDYDEIHREIKLMAVAQAQLEPESFFKLKRASVMCNQLVRFFKPLRSEYPLLAELVGQMHYTKDIVNAIDKVFNERGIIRDQASPELAEIRRDIRSLRQKINHQFDREIRKLRAAGMLAETDETFIHERRVLAVESSFKRKVSGHILGSSKSGAVTFIEPEANLLANSELDGRRDDERREIARILRALTAELQGHLPLISLYQHVLSELDFVQAKVRLALAMDADLPQISKTSHIELIDAYHPILLLKNKQSGASTIPQTLRMDPQQRMLVISGPNAGGKSITLKTVGLLQIMWQCGLMIPAKPESTMSFFQQILSDIGDHQSIENQLSTYSSRLKTMKTFLEQANRKTLLLLDEFGTGSDPELGGALAEVFFEELYRKKCFAVITTHYGNIKIKADQLPNAINGCMLFDRKSLAPLYRLDMGAPGSSFTFEVAQINGIPMDLVERAKRNLKRGTVRMDELLSRLQKEKASLGQLRKSLEEETSAARKMEREFKDRLDVLREKQERLSEKSSEQNDWVVKGKKLEQFVEKYGRKGKARETLEEVRRYLAMERDKKRDKAKKKQATARSKTAKTPAQKAPKMKRHLDLIQVGSQVKMDGSNLKMEVIALEDGMATLSYGSMKTKVELSRLVYMDPRKA